MTLRFQVRYENGVLVPDHPIALPEHQRFTVTVDTADDEDPMPAGGVELVEWRERHRIVLDPQDAHRIIMSKAYEYYEEPDDEP